MLKRKEPVKSSFTSRAKQAFQLSQKEARMKDMYPLPQNPKQVKSSFTSRAKQAFQLSQREARIGQVLQPKVLGVGKKSQMVFKIGGKLGGLARAGSGLALGFVGDLAYDEMRKLRDQSTGMDWGVLDNITDVVGMGASFVNPILGLVTKPIIGGIGLLAQEAAKNNAIGGVIGMSNDEAGFLEWMAEEMKKDKAAKQKPGTPTDIGTLAYQERKREEFKNLKGYYDDFEFLEWYGAQVKKDEAAAGYSENDYGAAYQQKKREEWNAKKNKLADVEGSVEKCELVNENGQPIPTNENGQPTSENVTRPTLGSQLPTGFSY